MSNQEAPATTPATTTDPQAFPGLFGFRACGLSTLLCALLLLLASLLRESRLEQPLGLPLARSSAALGRGSAHGAGAGAASGRGSANGAGAGASSSSGSGGGGRAAPPPCAHAAGTTSEGQDGGPLALSRAAACGNATLALVEEQLALLESQRQDLQREAAALQAQAAAQALEVAALQHAATGRVPLCVARQVARVRVQDLGPLMATPREALAAMAPHPAAAFFLLAPRDYKPEERHWERVADFALDAAADTDVFVVMSGVEREVAFAAYVAERAAATGRRPNPRLFTLDVDAWTGSSDAGLSSELHGRNAIVATKCYFALAVLHPCYEFALRLDAEVQLLRPELLVPHVRGYLANGLLFATSGAEQSAPHLLVNAVQHYFNASEQERWRALTLDHHFFWHFGSMPVYDLRDAPAFLVHVRQAESPPFVPPVPPGAGMSLNNWEMDKYCAWKAMRGDWRFLDVNRELGLPPTFPRLEAIESTEVYTRLATAHPPGTLWTRAAVCGLNQCACRAMPDAIAPLMFFHLNYPSVGLECAAPEGAPPWPVASSAPPAR
jgi:hypothetical protein